MYMYDKNQNNVTYHMLISVTTRIYLICARVAQWLEAQIGNHEIESSNPTGGA